MKKKQTYRSKNLIVLIQETWRMLHQRASVSNCSQLGTMRIFYKQPERKRDRVCTEEQGKEWQHISHGQQCNKEDSGATSGEVLKNSNSWPRILYLVKIYFTKYSDKSQVFHCQRKML